MIIQEMGWSRKLVLTRYASREIGNRRHLITIALSQSLSFQALVPSPSPKSLKPMAIKANLLLNSIKIASPKVLIEGFIFNKGFFADCSPSRPLEQLGHSSFYHLSPPLCIWIWCFLFWVFRIWFPPPQFRFYLLIFYFSFLCFAHLIAPISLVFTHFCYFSFRCFTCSLIANSYSITNFLILYAECKSKFSFLGLFCVVGSA